MPIVGRVESLWRYPVKSMRGEEVPQAFVGFAGVYGDRLFAFRDSGARKGFPYLTGREQARMLLYRPKFRHPQFAMAPPDLAEAERLSVGATPLYGSIEDMMVDVETPAGNVLAIDDPALIAELSDGLDDGHVLSLIRSDRALTDCRPVSVFSLQTIRQIGREAGLPVDKRRFRANIYADLRMEAFSENALVGGRLGLGAKVVIAVIGLDPRCRMITLDPETAEASPKSCGWWRGTTAATPGYSAP
jgi:hypothetical protein